MSGRRPLAEAGVELSTKMAAALVCGCVIVSDRNSQNKYPPSFVVPRVSSRMYATGIGIRFLTGDRVGGIWAGPGVRPHKHQSPIHLK